MKERRTIMGYLDMGRIMIPPTAQYTVMTDRGTGALWLLQYNIARASPDGYGYISINSVLPTTPDVDLYGPYEGPYVTSLVNGKFARLLIRNGSLGFELVTDSPTTDISQGDVIARVGLSRTLRKIIFPTSWSALVTALNTLGFTPENV